MFFSHSFVFQALTWAQADQTILAGIDWLLNSISEMSRVVRDFIVSRTTESAASGRGGARAGKSGGGGNDAAAARKRMMDAIQKKAAAFIKGMPAMDSLSSDEDDITDRENEAKTPVVPEGAGGAARAQGDDAAAALDHQSEGGGMENEEDARQPGHDGGTDEIPGEGVAVDSRDGGRTNGGNQGGAGVSADGRRRSAGGRRSLGKGSASRKGPPLPTCIVCREVTDGALGYVGFGQASVVLDERHLWKKESPHVHLQV